METRNVRPLPIVAGDLALDFANTVDDPEGPARHDHLADYPALLTWSVQLGTLAEQRAAALRRLSSRRPGESSSAMEDAHALRDGIRTLFGGVVDEGLPPAAAWARLRPHVVTATEHAETDGSAADGVRWRWPDADDLTAPLWPVAQAAADLLVSPHLTRVKRCAGCPWLFVDRSRNGSRRWCAMEDCGTHAKIQRYVTRRAARRTG